LFYRIRVFLTLRYALAGDRRGGQTLCAAAAVASPRLTFSEAGRLKWIIKHLKPKKTGIGSSPPTILTVKEVSEYLRVHPTTIYRLLHTKQLPGFHVGSDWRFDIDAIDRWCSEEAPTTVSARSRKGSS
jgi:excisionase family DNA binding protein